MTVFETVADLVGQIREASQPVQGEWSDARGLVAWMDEDGADRLIIASRLTDGLFFESEWQTHPAVFVLPDLSGNYTFPPNVAFAGWALEDGALEAVVAAEVNPEYARAAHTAGVTDAWQLIEAWRNGIAVEYLGPFGGGA